MPTRRPGIWRTSPSVEARIPRYGPPYCGAILFVDQYPERCFVPDLADFEAHPPKVIAHSRLDSIVALSA